MLICDTHADTLYAMQTKAPDELDVTLERLKAGQNTRVQALALFVGSNGLKGKDADLIQRELQSFEGLKKQGFRQIRRLSEALPGEANVFLTIEGGEAFGGDPASVERFARLGVRMAAIIWNNENGLAHSAVSGSDQGLTPLGWQIVAELRRCQIAVDISHLNERGSWELLESDLPITASHSCAKALCRHPRNLNDGQLKAIFQKNGFVGVNFYATFLADDEKASLDTVIDHVAYMCDLGGENSVGLGSDFDGIDRYPVGLRHAGQIGDLLERMQKRGFNQKLVEAVAGQNFARYMARLEGERL